jgi:hypothetical protein
VRWRTHGGLGVGRLDFVPVARFPISYNGPMRRLLGALGLGARSAWVEVDDSAVEVRMGWGFRARVPRSAVSAAQRTDRRVVSQGIHGRGGRWLVNGSSQGIVCIDLAPEQQARVLGRRVALSSVEVSVEDPDALVAALSAAV